MTDRLRLSERHRNILTALLREHLPGVEVWAYGSRVNDRGHEGRDWRKYRLSDWPTSRKRCASPRSRSWSKRGTGLGSLNGSTKRSSGNMWCW